MTSSPLRPDEMSREQKETSLQAWGESAPYWEKHRESITALFRPITDALIEAASIVPGQSVLDLAGGMGEPSLTIAGMVGPTGSVTCTDGVAGMVQAAARAARRLQLPNISFQQFLADSLPFISNRFDRSVCRLGVMLFARPFTAIEEMLRVTKPGGKLAFAVWCHRERNPFSAVVSEVLSHHMQMPEGEPDAPGAFRFAELGKLQRLVGEAGGIQVRERLLKFNMTAPLTVSQYWSLRSETSDTLRLKLAGLSPRQRRLVEAEVKDAVQGFFHNGQMSFPAEIIIVWADKPRG